MQIHQATATATNERLPNGCSSISDAAQTPDDSVHSTAPTVPRRARRATVAVGVVGGASAVIGSPRWSVVRCDHGGAGTITAGRAHGPEPAGRFLPSGLDGDPVAQPQGAV